MAESSRNITSYYVEMAVMLTYDMSRKMNDHVTSVMTLHQVSKELFIHYERLNLQ